MNLNDIKVGIEVEIENVQKILEHDCWVPEHEGMLRGGIEYVLRGPLPLNKAMKATKELYSEFTTEEFTQRCGIHVHIDVRGMSRVQRFNLITLYTVLEPLLLDSLLPSERIGNNFCLPVSDALDIEDILVECALGHKELQDLQLGHYKYGAMNLASIGNLGSLEFRALHGTRDVEELLYWVEALATLALESHKDLTPPDLVVMMSELTPKVFVERFLPHNDKISDNNKLEDLLYEGVRNAQRFAFLGDWNE